MTGTHEPAAAALLALAASATLACGPVAPHRTEPRTLRYVSMVNGQSHGWIEVTYRADGMRLERSAFNDRGRGPELKRVVAYDERGAPRWMRITGVDYWKAPVDERLDTIDGELRWRSATRAGSAPAGRGFYLPANLTAWDLPGLLRALRAAPDHRVELLPVGTLHLDGDEPRTFTAGGRSYALHMITLSGLGFEPLTLWADDDDEEFAIVIAGSGEIRAGAEALLPQLSAQVDAAHAARQRQLATRLTQAPPPGGVAIIHARLFDSERGAIVPDATVVIDGDRIVAVGDARTAVPAGARVIDAHGQTLLPGMWDLHEHVDGASGALALATGVTTIRDLGNDPDDVAARRRRWDDGTELGPRALIDGLIDGRDAMAAPAGIYVGDAAEARAAVARYATMGFEGIKIYNSVLPALVPPMIEEAHARHLRVGGHIPQGMTASTAIDAGFDEIHHVTFLALQFLARPDDDLRTPTRFTRIGEDAGDLDLDGAPMRALLDQMVAHHTLLDPTLVAFETMFSSDPTDVAKDLAPYLDRLPVTVRELARGGGLDAPGPKRARYRRSFAALVRLVKHAYDRGIPILPGTDQYGGLSYARELELYVQAGIPPREVLRLATIQAARAMGLVDVSGSIAVGKRADLVLIDGDPTVDIGAVREVALTMCRGRMYDPGALFEALGGSRRR